MNGQGENALDDLGDIIKFSRTALTPPLPVAMAEQHCGYINRCCRCATGAGEGHFG